MYISLKWVENISGLKDISLSVLCEKLTRAGFEIEQIIIKDVFEKKDVILDISLTANRSDLFNTKGFIKELSAIFFQIYNFEEIPTKKIYFLHKKIFSKKGLGIKSYVWQHLIQKRYFYNNKAPNKNYQNFISCSNFFSIESNLIKIEQSPVWVQKCLNSSNITCTNNVIDTINFITLETGYTFFALDLNKLKNYLNTKLISFSVLLPPSEQKILVEDDQIIILKPNNLLLYANNRIISIIGLLTLREIEVDENTTDIIVYGGIFDPVQIRKSSQSLGLRTEQSVSLEKSLNLNSLEQAFIRLTFLFRIQGIHLKNKNSPTIHHLKISNKPSFKNYVQDNRPKLKLNYKEVNDLLGYSKPLSKEKILNIVQALNFQVIKQENLYCELYIPFSRQTDIEREVDLIEEIVRIHGFTDFLSIIPTLNQIGKFTKLEKLKRLLRKTCINLGLNEVLHYSLSNYQSVDQVELKNPIAIENSFFRLSLLTQLICKASLNKNQKNNVFEAFEIGRAYHKSKDKKIQEVELISGIFGNNLYRSNWNYSEKSINWFEAKGFVDLIFNTLDIDIAWSRLEKHELKFLHPGRTAKISINNQLIGFFGQIHPGLAKTNSLNNETFLFEFNLDILQSFWKEKRSYTYNAYSLYPVSLIDLACIKNDKILFQDIEKEIKKIGSPILESISLFDYYSGNPIPVGYHSLGFKLKFRIFDRTLTHKEVDSIVQQIIKSLKEKFDIIVRK